MGRGAPRPPLSARGGGGAPGCWAGRPGVTVRRDPAAGAPAGRPHGGDLDRPQDAGPFSPQTLSPWYGGCSTWAQGSLRPPRFPRRGRGFGGGAARVPLVHSHGGTFSSFLKRKI